MKFIKLFVVLLLLSLAQPLSAQGVKIQADEIFGWTASNTSAAGAVDTKLSRDSAGFIRGSDLAGTGGGFVANLYRSLAADPADVTTGLALGNLEVVAWEANPTGADITLGPDSNEVLQIVGGTLDGGDLAPLTVTGSVIAINTIDGTKIQYGAEAQGAVLYYDSTNWTFLAAGTSGQFLKTLGAGANPVWDTVAPGVTLPVADTTSIAEGSSDTSKEVRFEVDGLTTATVITLTVPNTNLILAGQNINNAFTVTQQFNVTSGMGATVRLTGANSTGFRIEDLDATTIPNYSSVIAFNPALTTSTLGQWFSYTGSTGARIAGFTSATDTAVVPLLLEGYHGGTPTQAGIRASAWKHDGGTNRTALANTELVFDLANAGTQIFAVYGNGDLVIGNGDGADAEAIRLLNTAKVAWEASPAGADITMGPDTSEIIQIVGGFLDGGDLAANTIDGTKIQYGAEAQGAVLYYDGTNWTFLAAGTSGQFLKTLGAGANPVWDTAGSAPFVDTISIVEGSADGSKEIRFELDGLTTGTVRVITPPDADFTMAGVGINNGFTTTQNINIATPLVGVAVRGTGTGSGVLRFEDLDTTAIPNYSSATGQFNPAITTSTVGQIGSITTGTGLRVQGLTIPADSAVVPTIIDGFHGSTTPSVAAVRIRGWKHDGATNVADLATTEVLFNLFNGNTTAQTVYGSGDLGLGSGDVADAGALRLANTALIGWEASPAGADVTISVDASEVVQVTGGTLDGADLTTNTVGATQIDETAAYVFSALDATTSTVSFTSPIFSSNNADPADAGIVRLANAETICWEASPTSSDGCIYFSTSERFMIGGASGGVIGTGFSQTTLSNIAVYVEQDSTPQVKVQSDGAFAWADTTADAEQTADTSIARAGVGFVRISDTASGTVDGGIAFAPDARTIADTGDASPAALTLLPEGSYVPITCSDADTCDITMSEAAGVYDGEVLTIINLSTNVVDMADTADVSELAGVFAMGQYDSITLLYVTDRWIETARSNN